MLASGCVGCTACCSDYYVLANKPRADLLTALWYGGCVVDVWAERLVVVYIMAPCTFVAPCSVDGAVAMRTPFRDK